MTPEGEIKRQIAEYLELVPGLWFTYSPMNRPAKGRRRTSRFEKTLLDITGYWVIEDKPIIFMVDPKGPDAKRRPNQIDLVNKVLRDGGFACFASSVEELRAKMRQFHPRVP